MMMFHSFFVAFVAGSSDVAVSTDVPASSDANAQKKVLNHKGEEVDKDREHHEIHQNNYTYNDNDDDDKNIKTQFSSSRVTSNAEEVVFKIGWAPQRKWCAFGLGADVNLGGDNDDDDLGRKNMKNAQVGIITADAKGELKIIYTKLGEDDTQKAKAQEGIDCNQFVEDTFDTKGGFDKTKLSTDRENNNAQWLKFDEYEYSTHTSEDENKKEILTPGGFQLLFKKDAMRKCLEGSLAAGTVTMLWACGGYKKEPEHWEEKSNDEEMKNYILKDVLRSHDMTGTDAIKFRMKDADGNYSIKEVACKIRNANNVDL